MGTLAEYMQHEGMTQRALAQALGLSVSYTNEIVHGSKTPSLETALKIQRVTDGRVCLSSLIKSPTSCAPIEREAS